MDFSDVRCDFMSGENLHLSSVLVFPPNRIYSGNNFWVSLPSKSRIIRRYSRQKKRHRLKEELSFWFTKSWEGGNIFLGFLRWDSCSFQLRIPVVSSSEKSDDVWIHSIAFLWAQVPTYDRTTLFWSDSSFLAPIKKNGLHHREGIVRLMDLRSVPKSMLSLWTFPTETFE